MAIARADSYAEGPLKGRMVGVTLWLTWTRAEAPAAGLRLWGPQAGKCVHVLVHTIR